VTVSATAERLERQEVNDVEPASWHRQRKQCLQSRRSCAPASRRTVTDAGSTATHQGVSAAADRQTARRSPGQLPSTTGSLGESGPAETARDRPEDARRRRCGQAPDRRRQTLDVVATGSGSRRDVVVVFVVGGVAGARRCEEPAERDQHGGTSGSTIGTAAPAAQFDRSADIPRYY